MPDLDELVTQLDSRDLLVRMVTYAIRCPKVAKLAVEKLSPMHFDEATQLEFFIVWHVASALWKEYQIVPQQQHLIDLSINVMIQQGHTEQMFHDSVRTLVGQIYAFEEQPWNVDYGIRLLNVFFNSVFIHDLSQLAQQFSGQTRDEVAEHVMESHKRLQIDQTTPMDPFDLETNVPAFVPKMPTGVSFFDILLGGGTLPSESYGILGPSGGGKTLLAIQIACSMAERGQHVEYFSYEQPAKDLQPRVLSCASKVGIDKIGGKQWHEMEEGVRDKIKSAANTARSYLHLHDRSSEGSTISDISSVVRERIDQGKAPRLVVIDWIWPLILRMTANSSRRNVEERKILQWATDEFKSIASKYGVAFLLLHQLSTEVVKRSAQRKPQWYNSAEAGSFAWLLHYCVAIGKADQQGYCWMVGSKARNAETQSTLVLLNGRMQRFEPTKRSMVYDERRSEFVDEENLNRMPGVKLPGTDETSEIAGETDKPPKGAEEDDYGGGEGAGVV